MSSFSLDPAPRPKSKHRSIKNFKARNLGTASIDLSSSHRQMLNLPSPYHDDFTPTSTSSAPSVLTTEIPVLSSPIPSQLPKPSKISNPFTTFFNRIRYTKLPQDNTDIETPNHNEPSSPISSSASSTPPPSHLPRKKHKPQKKLPPYTYTEETLTEKWHSIIFLLFLLSILLNAFLLFNGPPNKIPHTPKPPSNPLPHDGFRFKDQHHHHHGHGGGGDKNYTCYSMHTTTFTKSYEYSNTLAAYDHVWRDMLGNSSGVVYTGINREDGKVRKAGLAMFHQLSCLGRLRGVIQGLQNGGGGKSIKDGDREKGEFDGDWLQCFDYLRQVLLCHADDAVEVGRVMDGKWVVGGVGEGGERECRGSGWLYEVTGCGEGGCEGGPFYRSAEEMEKIHGEEEEEVEKAKSVVPNS